MSDWSNYITPAITAFVVVFVLRWLIDNRSKARPSEGNIEAGRVQAPKWIAYACLIMFGTVFSICAVAALWYAFNNEPQSFRLWSILALAFLPFFLLAFPILQEGWDVSWDKNGVCGPIKVYTLRPMKHQKCVLWTEVKAFGTRNGGQVFFVQDMENDRIQWSGIASGAAAPLEAAKIYAPSAEEQQLK